jgi:hypothetical protein
VSGQAPTEAEVRKLRIAHASLPRPTEQSLTIIALCDSWLAQRDVVAAQGKALEICVNWILDVRRAAQNPGTSSLSSSALIEGATKILDEQLAVRSVAAVVSGTPE